MVKLPPLGHRRIRPSRDRIPLDLEQTRTNTDPYALRYRRDEWSTRQIAMLDLVIIVKKETRW